MSDGITLDYCSGCGAPDGLMNNGISVFSGLGFVHSVEYRDLEEVQVSLGLCANLPVTC